MIWSVSQGTVQDELLHAFSVFRPVPSLTPLLHGFPGDVVAASQNGCHSWSFLFRLYTITRHVDST